jgi:pyridoxal phosphate enzyme (YggS family)
VSRAEEIAARLDHVRDRIRAACAEAGRSPDEVVLIVVTKTFPVSDVRILAELGVRDVGENRDQEAAVKVRQAAGLGARWHFVGQLQTNKAASVASYADVVHSVDRERLVAALDRAAHGLGRVLDVFIQVRLDDAPGRGGAVPADVPKFADLVGRTSTLQLLGVMAIAPLGTDPAPAFERLAKVAADVRTAHPTATSISAGMSGDLEVAIRYGATHVRVGSAILGTRPTPG